MSEVRGEKDNKNLGRDQISEKYKWNLRDLFVSKDEWQNEKNNLDLKFKDLERFKNNLSTKSGNLLNCLNLYSDLLKRLSLLASYAHQSSDLDLRQAESMAMRQEVDQLSVKLSAFTSFIDPEIISIPIDTLESFYKEKPALLGYSQYIDNILRLKNNIRSASEEEIISQAGLMSSSSSEIYEIFKYADMPRPVITLSNGESVRLDDANFSLYRASKDRGLRKKVFEKSFESYKKYEGSFGAQLYSQVKTNVFYKNIRHHNSSLESALSVNNIPSSVYSNLISAVHENLPVLHRYLSLRQRILGLDQLHYYDLYTPLVKDVDINYSYEEAQDLVKKSLEPLGSEYLDVLKKSLDDRWVDVYPSEGKRSGAYSSASYGAHPFILMNYMGKYEDVSTLTHELGHAIHSYYSNKNQNYFNANYPIFLAEVASTNNEALLTNEMLKGSKDQQGRLSILGSQLEHFRTTLFRQTQFAEFELKINELVEEGKALTGEEISKAYLEILRTYYGHEEGITLVDDLYGVEWASVPHFYYNFYVFQYATSLCASTVISEKIINKEEKMQERYINDFLSAGCSDYAIPTLKRLGVDMTSPEPYQVAFRKMNSIIDEMEKILNN